MKKMEYKKNGHLILGVNGWIESGHDASAALIEVTKSSCRIIVALEEENELKFVVDKSCEEMNLFIDAVSSNVKHDYVYLQPESNKNSMISNCVEMISENSDYRLSLQIHKIIGIE